MKCRHCFEPCIKKGKTGNHQRYKCSTCMKYQQEIYSYNSHLVMDMEIIGLIKEGVGILGISRLLQISKATVIRRTVRIGKSIRRSSPIVFGQKYQVDELFTYVGHKKNRVCVAYSIEESTGNVIDIVVGRRNKTNLRKVISTLVLAEASQITTDKLNIYKELIPSTVHSTKHRGINKIERKNLTLRTHLKRLNRRTICYSKSIKMLDAVLRIYFWFGVKTIL
ncbi:IS1 family transposase [Fluviicola taffensis]|nr:IS1 family transposase [Fluviicola taffensis]